MIEVVAATRMELDRFKQEAMLARSMRRLKPDKRLSWKVAIANNRGLPDVYNDRLAATAEDIIVFTHDDVWIDDIFLAERLEEALKHFDLIGVAGNTRRVPRQPSWFYSDDQMTPDLSTLSGSIATGSMEAPGISQYGATPAECELLDGMFLAARVETLRTKAVRFDPKFRFHFYDMDICRSARLAGLRLGTWPIALTHASTGDFTSPAWQEGLALYREKWPD